ncbi:hypothetical protein D9757_002389 [Collybiopsis confluens]|uniref:Uncharacterized protein n=1 Tax=Collybiopsis confluens TaxID=2823264 RepID=A0A8H5HY32_9AGAR|nr:hypothetical protein D9757_002389 [Collybiopsis confluens]
MIQRRRRRRTAVDPCLGFYTQEATDEEPVRAQESPKVLPSPPAEPVQSNTIKSVTRPRTYAKKHLKRTAIPESELSSPPLLKRRKPNPLRVDSPPDKVAPRRRRPALAERLLQAAVVSGVDPTESLIEPNPNAPIPTRKTLHFQVSGPFDKFRRRSPKESKLVDPRTSSRFLRTASFISSREKKTLLPPKQQYKPLIHWSANSSRSNQSGSRTAITARSKSNKNFQSKRNPLKLVPVHQSELVNREPYRTLGHGVRSASIFRSTSIYEKPLLMSTSVRKYAPPENAICPGSVASPSLTVPVAATLNDPTKYNGLSATASHEKFLVPPEAMPEPLSDAIDSTFPCVLTINQETPIATTPEQSLLLFPSPSSPLPSAFYPTALRANQLPLDNALPNSFASASNHATNTYRPSQVEHSLNTFQSPFGSPDRSSQRPSKPLPSFFGEFLETVRAATSKRQRQKSDDISGRRKRVLSVLASRPVDQLRNSHFLFDECSFEEGTNQGEDKQIESKFSGSVGAFPSPSESESYS